VTLDLLREQRDVLPGRQPDDLEPLGMPLHNVQRLPPDAPRRAENRNALAAGH